MPDEEATLEATKDPFLKADAARHTAQSSPETSKALSKALEAIASASAKGALWCHVESWKVSDHLTAAMMQLVDGGYDVWMVHTNVTRDSSDYSMSDGWLIAWGEVPSELFNLAMSNKATHFIRF